MKSIINIIHKSIYIILTINIIFYQHAAFSQEETHQTDTSTDKTNINPDTATNKAKEITKDYWKRLKNTVIEEKTKIDTIIKNLNINQYLDAVNNKKLTDLKACCENIDLRLDTTVMHYYYKAFEIEATEGPEKAKEYLEKTLKDKEITDIQRKGIFGLHKYFEAKGSISTAEAAVAILIIALEIKFPHGQGALILKALLNKNEFKKEIEKTVDKITEGVKQKEHPINQR